MTNLQEIIIGAAFAAGGYEVATRKALKDITGISKKLNCVIATLELWADTEEKRKHVADLIRPTGNGK